MGQYQFFACSIDKQSRDYASMSTYVQDLIMIALLAVQISSNIKVWLIEK